MDNQKAWFYKEYGPTEVLECGEFPVPELGANQVLVRVRAAALNPVDFKRRNGMLKEIDSKLPIVPGCDMAGVIVDQGDDVSKFSKGDEVYGNIQNIIYGTPKQCGTLTQYTAVEESLIALKPGNMSFEEAASFPLALQTAQEAFDRVEFQKGQTVFIVGGAGGVGSLAIQLAKYVYGASMIATTTSTGKVNFVKQLGANMVIDYTKQSYKQIPEKFDFVFDTIGDSHNSYILAKDEGKIIDIVDDSPHPRAVFFFTNPNGSNLERIRGYIECERLKPVLDPTSPYTFSNVIEAFKHLESGRATGKIVIFPIE
uniref:Enoyl reductase (ER) domain-containing protein n=1 Tax=Araucaria cunninghamii TaxID=56994 RepID=A0A0D6R8N0_ARACU